MSVGCYPFSLKASVRTKLPTLGSPNTELTLPGNWGNFHVVTFSRKGRDPESPAFPESTHIDLASQSR